MAAISTRYGPPEPSETTQEACDATHPGFTITCDQCTSTLVYVENSLGFSSTSGAWGDVSLTCAACNQTVELVSP